MINMNKKWKTWNEYYFIFVHTLILFQQNRNAAHICTDFKKDVNSKKCD